MSNSARFIGSYFVADKFADFLAFENRVMEKAYSIVKQLMDSIIEI